MEEIVGTEIIRPEEIRLGHTWHEVEVLKKFIDACRPDNFVELGIHEGGLTYILLPLMTSILHYVAVEIDCSIIRPIILRMFFENKNSSLLCIDCMEVERVLSHCVSYTKIIYCDNGHKAQELVAYAQYCRSGDVLMAHDFHDGIRKVRGVPDPHPEVVPADIEFLENDPTFERLDESLFKETRIIGFRKL